MLSRSSRLRTPWPCGNHLEAGILLPFLYYTATIRRPYTREPSSRDKARDTQPATSSTRRISRGRSDGSVKAPGQRVQKADKGWATIDVGGDTTNPPSADDGYPGDEGETSRPRKDSGRDAVEMARPRHDKWGGLRPVYAERRSMGEARETSRRGYDPGTFQRGGETRPQERRVDHVPFEKTGDAGSPAAEDSTITPTERKAFEKLFKLSQKNVKSDDKPTKPNHETDVDTILNTAVSAIKARQRPKPEFPAALRPLAEEALAKRNEVQRAAKSLLENESPRARRLRIAIEEDLQQVTMRMQEATTDVALHASLQTYVLDRVAALELDGAPTPHVPLPKPKPQPTTPNSPPPKPGPPGLQKRPKGISDNQVLNANLALHLKLYARTLRTAFPSSSLRLTLLPTLKSLGPAPFALAATTTLYNEHLLATYSQHPTRPEDLVAVLEEMDREVYDFDGRTLKLVEKVLKDAKALREGAGGEGLRALWGCERVGKAVGELEQWRGVVERRWQEAALREVRELEREALALAQAEGEGEVGSVAAAAA